MHSSSELNTAGVQPMPVFSYPTAHYIRKRSQEPASPRVEMPHDQISSRSPARSVRSATPAFPARNHENASRSQVNNQIKILKRPNLVGVVS